MRVFKRRHETPEEARQRRLCRLMLGLPPETVYHHVREGVVTVAGLALVLLFVIVWRAGQLATLAPILFGAALIAMMTPTVLMARRHYRHVVAAMLVLVMLLGLLAAAVHRYGSPTVALFVDPTPSAVADAVSPR
jgi:hypothetical protein